MAAAKSISLFFASLFFVCTLGVMMRAQEQAKDSPNSTVLGSGHGIDHVAIAVKDLETANKTYRDVLGFAVFAGGKLNSPLGLALTPNHHLVAANGGDGNLVEINPATKTQVAVKLVDKTPPPPLGAGSLFGLATVSNGVYFVDDVANNFQFLH